LQKWPSNEARAVRKFSDVELEGNPSVKYKTLLQNEISCGQIR
jgi:hypothetical protein